MLVKPSLKHYFQWRIEPAPPPNRLMRNIHKQTSKSNRVEVSLTFLSRTFLRFDCFSRYNAFGLSNHEMFYDKVCMTTRKVSLKTSITQTVQPTVATIQYLWSNDERVF